MFTIYKLVRSARELHKTIRMDIAPSTLISKLSSRKRKMICTSASTYCNCGTKHESSAQKNTAAAAVVTTQLSQRVQRQPLAWTEEGNPSERKRRLRSCLIHAWLRCIRLTFRLSQAASASRVPSGVFDGESCFFKGRANGSVCFMVSFSIALSYGFIFQHLFLRITVYVYR
jgi:hypothetical protein